MALFLSVGIGTVVAKSLHDATNDNKHNVYVSLLLRWESVALDHSTPKTYLFQKSVMSSLGLGLSLDSWICGIGLGLLVLWCWGGGLCGKNFWQKSVEPGFHYPSWRVTWRPVNSASGNARPCWRVMETGHPLTRAVNSVSGNRALLCYSRVPKIFYYYRRWR